MNASWRKQKAYFKTKSYAITEVPSVGIDIDWGSSMNHVYSLSDILTNLPILERFTK